MTPHVLDNTTRRVTIIKDHVLTIPELYLEVYIGPGPDSERRPFNEFFAKARCNKADTPEQADLVVFVGGDDVDPALYGAKRHETTFFNTNRDKEEIELFQKCHEGGIPMFGVCRGAQFLHVMHGGKLYQDVNNHVGDHSIYLKRESRILHNVSSVHHQMCIFDETLGMELLADSSAATERWLDPDTYVKGQRFDCEAYFYRDTCTFGVQGHPEYKGYNYFADWVYKSLNSLIIENPDMTLINRVRRIKPDILEERRAIKKNLLQKELN